LPVGVSFFLRFLSFVCPVLLSSGGERGEVKGGFVSVGVWIWNLECGICGYWEVADSRATTTVQWWWW